MLGTGADWKTVGDLSIRGSRKKVVDQLESVIDILCRKDFEARLRTHFGLRTNVGRRVGGVPNGINQVLRDLERGNAA